ncbi:MAG: redox-sensing transcriptional repressor Rex [Salinispira sp.]
MPNKASAPTIRRLPSYLLVIENARREGQTYISGTSIAAELHIEAIQVRKDLAVTGISGKPRIGFQVDELIQAIHAFLNWDRKYHAIIVGAGNLGSALTGYTEFKRHGMIIIAAFDSDERKTGSTIHGIPIYSMSYLTKKIQELKACIAILTVPSDQAQNIADVLTEAGIRAIWNFTNVKITVPENVIVQKEDLSSGYAALSVKLNTP